MRKLIVFLSLIVAFGLDVSAQDRGWMIGLEYEGSNYEGKSVHPQMYSRAFKLGAGYRIPLPISRFYIQPKVNINYRWGETSVDGIGLLVGHSYRSFGCGVNAFMGFRIFKFLEVFTGPGADWYFYNHENVSWMYPYVGPPTPFLDGKSGVTYAYWIFGAGIPIGRFTIEGTYRQHLNSPGVEIQLNRWTVGATFRF